MPKKLTFILLVILLKVNTKSEYFGREDTKAQGKNIFVTRL